MTFLKPLFCPPPLQDLAASTASTTPQRAFFAASSDHHNNNTVGCCCCRELQIFVRKPRYHCIQAAKSVARTSRNPKKKTSALCFSPGGPICLLISSKHVLICAVQWTKKAVIKIQCLETKESARARRRKGYKVEIQQICQTSC